MTVRDLKLMLEALPDEFVVRIDARSDTSVHVRSVSLEHGALVLREHMLTVGAIVDTVTAYDGVEYVVEVKRVKYPTVVQMPQPIHAQLRASMAKFDGD